MRIQPYELQLPESETVEGVVLVCTTSGRVLNIPVHAFRDFDDAEAWLRWLGTDPRQMRDVEIDARVTEWRGLRWAVSCPCCGTRDNLHLSRAHCAPHPWILGCHCDGFDPAVNAPNAAGAVSEWNAAVAAQRMPCESGAR